MRAQSKRGRWSLGKKAMADHKQSLQKHHLAGLLRQQQAVLGTEQMAAHYRARIIGRGRGHNPEEFRSLRKTLDRGGGGESRSGKKDVKE